MSLVELLGFLRQLLTTLSKTRSKQVHSLPDMLWCPSQTWRWSVASWMVSYSRLLARVDSKQAFCMVVKTNWTWIWIKYHGNPWEHLFVDKHFSQTPAKESKNQLCFKRKKKLKDKKNSTYILSYCNNSQGIEAWKPTIIFCFGHGHQAQEPPKLTCLTRMEYHG